MKIQPTQDNINPHPDKPQKPRDKQTNCQIIIKRKTLVSDFDDDQLKEFEFAAQLRRERIEGTWVRD